MDSDEDGYYYQGARKRRKSTKASRRKARGKLPSSIHILKKTLATKNKKLRDLLKAVTSLCKRRGHRSKRRSKKRKS